MKSHVAVVVLLIGSACGDRTAAFRPTENVTARGHGGQPAAAYQVRHSPDADPHVHVNVWSRGAYRDGGRTYVDLTMSVRNTSDRPVRLAQDAFVLEAFADTGAPLPPPLLTRIDTDALGASVAPGAAGTFHLRFEAPRELEPSDIGGLRLRWGILHDSGQRYVQFTEFQRVREQVTTTWAYYDPVFGFYDPFLYGTHRYNVPVGRVIISDRDRSRPRPRSR